MKRYLLLLLAVPLFAQNPNPCTQIRNNASPGQVLSAVNAGKTPPCQWIAAGGGGTGSVTSVAASNGLTASPNPITTTGTISGINAAADGSTKGVSAFTASDFNATTGVISLDYANGQKASGSQPGFLSSADWTTFNGKQAGGVAITALTGDVTATGPGSAAATIANDAVTTVKILNANVTAAKMVNAGVFTGDVTTTFPAITVAKVNGIAYSATGAAHSVPVITTANTTATYKAVPDCTDTGGNHLNFTQSTDAFSCGTSGSSGGITIGTTTITSGTTTRVLYDNAGVVGEYTVSGSGNVAMTTSPTFVTPVLGTPTSGTLTNTTGLPCASGIVNNYGCLLQICTPSAVAQCDFTAITSTYDEYVLEAISVVCANNAVQAELQVSTDGGSTFVTSGYTWVANELAADSASGSVGESTSDSKMVWGGSRGSPGIGNGSGKSFSGFVHIYNPLSASLYKTFIGKESHIYQSNSTLIGGDFFGQYQSATAVNAIRFRFNDGTVRNISSGTMNLYGKRKT